MRKTMTTRTQTPILHRNSDSKAAEALRGLEERSPMMNTSMTTWRIQKRLTMERRKTGTCTAATAATTCRQASRACVSTTTPRTSGPYSSCPRHTHSATPQPHAHSHISNHPCSPAARCGMRSSPTLSRSGKCVQAKEATHRPMRVPRASRESFRWRAAELALHVEKNKQRKIFQITQGPDRHKNTNATKCQPRMRESLSNTFSRD